MNILNNFRKSGIYLARCLQKKVQPRYMRIIQTHFGITSFGFHMHHFKTIAISFLLFFSYGTTFTQRQKRLFPRRQTFKHINKIRQISKSGHTSPFSFHLKPHHESVPLFTSEKIFHHTQKRVKRILYAENLALEVEIVFCESIPLGTPSGIFSKNYLRRKKSSLLALFLDSI